MSKGTVLLVQESATQRAHLSSTLEQSGFSVFQAGGATDGLESAQANQPKVIVSDISLSDEDGFALCRLVRADASLKDVPVLLLTGLSDGEDVIGALDSGASGFLLKPFSEEELEARIEFLLSNPVTNFVSQDAPLKYNFLESEHEVKSSREQAISLLLTTFESAARHHKQISKETLALKMRIRELERQVASEPVPSEAPAQPVEQPASEGGECLWTAHLRHLKIPLQVHSSEGIAIFSNALWEEQLGPMVLAGADSSLEGSVVEGNEQRTFALSIQPCRWENQEATVVFAFVQEVTLEAQVAESSGKPQDRLEIGEELLNALATHNRNLTRGIRKGLSVLVGNEPQIAQIENLVSQVEAFDLFARDASSLLMKSASVDLHATLTDILETFPVRQEVAQRSLNMSVDCPAGLVANADSRLLRLATVELLKNAIAASQPGGPVRARALVEGSKLVISVRDAGPGIDPAIRDQVTSRFFSTWPGHIGIGLYLVSRVAEAHGGSLNFIHHSNGTEVVMEIPQA